MTDCRLVSSFPLSSSVISTLISCGFRVLDDFYGLEPLDIHDETKLSMEDSLIVWKHIQLLSQPMPSTSTAAAATTSTSSSMKSFTSFKELIDKSKTEIPIITFCKAIDELFGLKKQAGVPIGQIVSCLFLDDH